MMHLVQNLSPILCAGIVAGMVWLLREQGTRKTAIRTRQLALAAECLDRHAAALGHILDDPEAPKALKRLAISVSDAMNDREIVGQLAEWASTRPLDPPPDTEETRAIEAILAPLRIDRPDLVISFTVAVATAVVGASFRWAESAVLSELMFSRLMTTPEREVACAATAIGLRPHGPFSVRPGIPVMA